MLTIDLSPLKISAIEQRNTDLILRLLNQPGHLPSDQRADDESKTLACAFVIKNGEVEVQNCTLPFESSEWELSYPGGSNAYFLPQGFEAVGPILLEFYERTDDHREKPPVLVLVGQNFALEILDESDPPNGGYSAAEV